MMIFLSKKSVVIANLIVVVAFVIAMYNKAIDISLILEAPDVSTIHFNILTINSIIAGFMFTGLSIILSFSDKEFVKRMERSDFMSVIYLFIILGLFLSFTSVTCSLLMILNFNFFVKWIVYIEVLTLVLSFFCLLISVLNILYIIKQIRKK